MKTLQDQWKQYRDSVYPQGITGIQNRECHQAFFAGALIALGLMTELSALPEDTAVVELEKLMREGRETCGGIASAMKDRN